MGLSPNIPGSCVQTSLTRQYRMGLVVPVCDLNVIQVQMMAHANSRIQSQDEGLHQIISTMCTAIFVVLATRSWALTST